MENRVVNVIILGTLLAGCGDAARDRSYRGEPVATIRLQTPVLPGLAAGRTRTFGAYATIRNTSGTEGQPGYRGQDGEVYVGNNYKSTTTGAPLVLDVPLYDIASDGGTTRSAIIDFEVLLEEANVPTSDHFSSDGNSQRFVAAEHVLVYSERAAKLFLFGPGGAETIHPGGLQMFRRVCKDNRITLEPAPLDAMVPLTLDTLGPIQNSEADIDRVAFKRCGLVLPVDALGTKFSDNGASALEWQPDGTGLIILSPTPAYVPSSDRALSKLNLVTGAQELAAFGSFGSSLQTASNGHIFVRETRFDPDSGIAVPHMVEMDFAPGVLPSIKRTRIDSDSDALVSPSGMYWATTTYAANSATTTIYSTAGVKISSANGTAIGWQPRTDILLIEDASVPADIRITTFSLDGAVSVLPVRSSVFPLATRLLGFFAGSSGAPELLATNRDIGLWSMPLTSVAEPQWLLNSTAGRLLPALSKSYASQGLFFIWARKCLGLHETQCVHDLHAIRPAERIDSIIAVSKIPGIVALSPLGDRVAIGTQTAIYMLPLPADLLR
jgi:hypothetical protein